MPNIVERIVKQEGDGDFPPNRPRCRFHEVYAAHKSVGSGR